jgi:membrane protein YdbS with pleckstrin-like domain
MELPSIRLWVIFYLIIFVMLLWAAFLSSQGTMLWLSLMFVIAVIAINFLVVIKELRRSTARAEMQQSFTKDMRVSRKHG